jgi:signal peptidase I
VSVDVVRRDLAERGAAQLRVDGGCMEPTLREGERVVVFRDGAPRRGDVVLLSASGWLEIHRVVDRIEMGPDVWYLHQGDASAVCGVAGPDDLLGRVASPRRDRPAARSHLRGLILRLGALLRRLGVPGA